MKHVKKFGKINEKIDSLNILNERINYLDEGVTVMPAVRDKINEIIEYINAMRNPNTGMLELEEWDDENGPTHG